MSSKTYAEYRAKRKEFIRKIEYHKQQSSYHEQQAKATEQLLLEFKISNSLWEDSLAEEKMLENQASIDRASRIAALDKDELKKRIEEKKAQQLIEKMMRNFT